MLFIKKDRKDPDDLLPASTPIAAAAAVEVAPPTTTMTTTTTTALTPISDSGPISTSSSSIGKPPVREHRKAVDDENSSQAGKKNMGAGDKEWELVSKEGSDEDWELV